MQLTALYTNNRRKECYSRKRRYFFLLFFRKFPGIIEHKWSDIQSYFNTNNLKENKVPGNGFCFLNAVRKCMLHDFYKFYTLKKLQEIVTEHLIENFSKYTEWHGSSADQLVYEATEFFNDRNFTADIVDIIVQATGDALDICMKIFRRSPAGNIQVVESGNKDSPRIINLKLSGTGGTAMNPDYTGDNHYDALTVKFKEIPKLPSLDEPTTKRKEPEGGFIDLTESPLKKRTDKSIS